MSKYNQIISALTDGASFSWGFEGISSPDPQGSLVDILERVDKGRIGYHTQVFLARAFLTDGMKITYIQEDGKIKIYF